MKKDYTHIAVIIDESGSMCGQQMDVIGGFNTFIKKQKEVIGQCTLSLIKFNNIVSEPVYNFIDINLVADLTEKTYHPGGGTALLDAVGKTVNEVGFALHKKPESERPEKVIVIIMTDGEENSSFKFKLEDVKSMIKEQSDIYKWQFVFIGAGLDAFQAGTMLGVASSSTLSSSHSATGYARAYASLGNNVTAYRCGTKSVVDFEQADIDAQVACGVDPSIANKSAKSS
jgi:uncharacterized protein YegL